MTFSNENPDLVRPTQRFPQSSGIAITTPVCRMSQECVGASYMIPALQVTDLSKEGNFPLSRKRKSRSLKSGLRVNCCLLASSWENPTASNNNPPPARMVKYGPAYSFHLTSLRLGSSGLSPA